MADPKLWALEKDIAFLNHGSFGACPREVLRYQQQICLRMEADPVQFFVRELENLLDQARFEVARFVGAQPENLVFVANATAGVNTVLRSLQFESGDELLVTDHEYNACRNALDTVAKNWRAKVVVVPLPFPLGAEDEIWERIMSHLTVRTRLVLIDHITSQTGLIMPIARIIRELERRGVDVLVDGAHAPGMLPLDVESLGAAYYTGNCHKWLCSPKVAGILCVRPDRQERIRPLSISHGANSPRTDRSRYQIEFGWTGTWDPSAMLTVPEAIRYLESLSPGGWPAIMRRNRLLVLQARQMICQKLGVPLPCPDEFIGAMASIPLPNGPSTQPPTSPLYLDPLQEWLWTQNRIEVPVIPWPAPPRRLLRISAQLYNALPQYELLANRLDEALQDPDWNR